MGGGGGDVDSMLKILLCFSRGRKLVYVGEPGLVSDGFVHLADRFETNKEKDGLDFEWLDTIHHGNIPLEAASSWQQIAK